MTYETLTDLLNNEERAYEYFYALPPSMQTTLRQRGDICSLAQLRAAVADAKMMHRPQIF